MKLIQRIDHNVDYQALVRLYEEFDRLWHRLHAFYFDAVAGFAFVRSRVEAEQAQARRDVEGSELDSEEFQDTRLFTYEDIFVEDFHTSGIHQTTQGQVKARNAPDGVNFTTLGQLCVVSFYDFWEDYLRREYVIAKGCLDRNEKNKKVVEDRIREHAKNDLWGDLGYLRNAIVHNQGVATGHVKRCKIIKWFKPGDFISITPAHMGAIFMALLQYRNDLFKESLPPSDFIVFC